MPGILQIVVIFYLCILTSSPEARTLKLVTGNNYKPYTDEHLASGGLFTELVTSSLMFGIYALNSLKLNRDKFSIIPADSYSSLHILISKNINNSNKIHKMFNQEIKRLKAEGLIKKIIKKHMIVDN